MKCIIVVCNSLKLHRIVLNSKPYVYSLYDLFYVRFVNMYIQYMAVTKYGISLVIFVGLTMNVSWNSHSNQYHKDTNSWGKI